ncbi:universal stress protein [Seonamhaeicola sp.]|uniref:universal stress protein n=1 Tax=Seonamhaeicola sp. TaxID=1912245 RepID=UPI00263508E5|nr:universal stress protein [Seonamhaeicola sp.]
MKNILIPIEFNSNEQKLIEMGSRLAEKFHSKIWLIHIASPEPDFVPYISGSGPNDEREHRASILKKERKRIQKYAETLNSKNIDTTALLIQGQTIQTIMEKVKTLNIDLIITGNNKHGFIYKLFLESVSEELVKKSDIPVLLVPLDS